MNGAKRLSKLLTLGILASTTAAVSAPLANTKYRDLNHNGRMDRYEDPQAAIPTRVEDLISQMTLDEKVGTVLHGTLPAPNDPFGATGDRYDLDALQRLVGERKITSMISRLSASPRQMAEQSNAVQRVAEQSRLGIPITISTDPRNHFAAVAGASVKASGFSQWPEPLGFAALGDPEVVRQFGRIVASEYRAVGLHMALSPQADLATEPRWSRTNATFGSDPDLVSRLSAAYVKGFQGGRSGLTRNGVATISKHWVGYGAQPSGFDAHNYYGRNVVLTNESLKAHLAAFSGVLAVKTAGVMPTYAILQGVSMDGQSLPEIGAGFSNKLLNGLLRRDYGFKGLVLSDWLITNDCPAACVAPSKAAPQTPDKIGMPWGMEKRTPEDRFAQGLNAGIDQFGGADDPAPVLAAVKSGKVSMERLNEAVRNVLTIKFQQGLFDDPFVNPEAAESIVNSAATRQAAAQTQAHAQVLLKNERSLLPLKSSSKRVFLDGVDTEAAKKAGLIVVTDLDQADFALIRMATPFETLHPSAFFGGFQHEGRLSSHDGDKAYETLKRTAAKVPTIVAIDMDRPAILTNVQDKARSIVAMFGASDDALLGIVTGKYQPRGHLPLELPSSESAVSRQRADLSDDSEKPLYPAGFGLSFSSAGGQHRGARISRGEER